MMSEPEKRQRSLDAVERMGEELSDRWYQKSDAAIKKLDTLPISEHNHRLVVLAVGVVGIVIPLYGTQAGAAAIPLRTASGLMLSSAIVLLVWDLLAPRYRGQAIDAILNHWTAASSAEWNRNAIRICQTFEQLPEAAKFLARQEELDLAEHRALDARNVAYQRMRRFDERTRGLAYVLLILGLMVLTSASLTIG